MVTNTKNSDTAQAGKSEEHKTSESGPENCRCKETAQMSPRQLLKRMVSDLAFWKKTKK